MNFGLKDKRALVTASSAGIGLSIAKSLALEGCHVFVNGRTEDRVKEAMEKICAEHPQAKLEPIVLDLGTKEGFTRLTKELKEIDILINNLGIYEVRDFFEISDEDWYRLFEVNVMSGIRLSRHFIPSMQKRGWGRVVFISSESGINIPTEMIHYGMTKTCQLCLTQGLAQTCKATGVTVNAVLPGPTWSEGVEKFVDDIAKKQKIERREVEKDFFRTVRASSLLQRFATTDEVASLVAYVCSEQAAAITGASLRVDGGIVRSIH